LKIKFPKLIAVRGRGTL